VEDANNDSEDTGGLPLNPFVDETSSEGAGIASGKGKTLFEEIHERQMREGANEGKPWAPFASAEEWGLAKWLMTSGLSQSEIDKYLKLSIVSA
jgi:hypothetical protein